MHNVADWVRVVDRVNDKILRIPEWTDEVNLTMKSTNLFIDGLIQEILSYAEYEKYRDNDEYLYKLFDSRVGMRAHCYVDQFPFLERSGVGDISLVDGFIQYRADGLFSSAKSIESTKSTPENILTLFLRIFQHESAGRKFNFFKWHQLDDSKDILNCDQYFD